MKTPQHTKEKKGFVSLFAVLMSTVILAIVLGMSSVALKQIILSSTASEANEAFYSADAGMQCAIMNDRSGEFAVGQDSVIFCGPSQISIESDDSEVYRVVGDNGLGFEWDNGNCVYITIDKSGEVTEIEAFGYNVACDEIGQSPRVVERALRVRYAG